jgi:hypothetical protein
MLEVEEGCTVPNIRPSQGWSNLIEQDNREMHAETTAREAGVSTSCLTHPYNLNWMSKLRLHESERNGANIAIDPERRGW